LEKEEGSIFYSNWRENCKKKREVYFTPIGEKIVKRRGNVIYLTLEIGVEFVKRRGNIFYSNWRGICF